MSRLAVKNCSTAEPQVVSKKSNSLSSPVKASGQSRSPAKNTRGASLRSNDSSPMLTNAVSDTQSGGNLQTSQAFEKTPTMTKINTHFLLDNGKSYKCQISPPCIEYSIPRENFMFVKNLSLQEIQEYASCVF